MPLTDDLRGISSLVADTVEQLAKLIQNEASLAKAEMSAKIADAGRAMAYLLGATLFITPAIVMLLFAFAQWLVAQGMSSAAAYFISAIVALALGGILALIGIQKLKSWSPAPTITVREIQRDVTVAKEIMR